MPPTRHERLADRVYQHLVAQLKGRELTRGDHLNAGNLADELGVARTTVRKAIARLIEEGWVSNDTRRRPVVVRSPRGSAAADTSSFDFANKMEHAYQAIFNQLVRGRLQLGETVNGREFADELHISLGTVRQAFDWLCRDGLLIRLPRRGWRVANFSLADVEDCYHFRSILETEALQRAAALQTEPPELQSLFVRCDELIRSATAIPAAELRLADLEFHRGLARASRSPMLLSLVEPLLRKSMLVGVTCGLNHVISLRAFEEHKAILLAIKAGKWNGAQNLLREHLTRSLDNLRIMYRELGVGAD